MPWIPQPHHSDQRRTPSSSQNIITVATDGADAAVCYSQVVVMPSFSRTIHLLAYRRRIDALRFRFRFNFNSPSRKEPRAAETRSTQEVAVCFVSANPPSKRQTSLYIPGCTAQSTATAPSFIMHPSLNAFLILHRFFIPACSPSAPPIKVQRLTHPRRDARIQAPMHQVSNTKGLRA